MLISWGSIQDIQKKISESEGNFRGLRGVICPLSTPLPLPLVTITIDPTILSIKFKEILKINK
jgi:hypothetical protein